MLSEQMAALGWRVFAGCLSQQAVNELSQHNENIHAFVFDVTKDEDKSNAVKILATECPHGLGGVVNNAGVLLPMAPVEWVGMDWMRHVMEVNFLAGVDLTLRMLPLLRKGRGRVVNVSSVASLTPPTMALPYFISKTAVAMWSDVLRQEMAPFDMPVLELKPTTMAYVCRYCDAVG